MAAAQIRQRLRDHLQHAGIAGVLAGCLITKYLPVDAARLPVRANLVPTAGDRSESSNLPRQAPDHLAHTRLLRLGATLKQRKPAIRRGFPIPVGGHLRQMPKARLGQAQLFLCARGGVLQRTAFAQVDQTNQENMVLARQHDAAHLQVHLSAASAAHPPNMARLTMRKCIRRHLMRHRRCSNPIRLRIDRRIGNFPGLYPLRADSQHLPGAPVCITDVQG